MNKHKHIDLIINKLSEKKSYLDTLEYRVPSIWLEKFDNAEIILTDPAEFYLGRLNRIKELSKRADKFDKKNQTVYNMFVRYTTAFDHNGDGVISLPGETILNETGSFLKAISILPYIRNLGCNIIYILPLTSIGTDGKKGTLGSPYSIKNPYKLDENLSEKFLGLNIETEFAAFVEACHLLGMKLICEFVFRTASIDSDLAQVHPEWFYWIRDDVENRVYGESDDKKYGPPVFTEEELNKIKENIYKNDLTDLIPPHEDYIDMFTEVPVKTEVIGNRIIGFDKVGVKSKIPGAFADWPPDDNQPPWEDVTYLRMYDHEDFNYIAYNTIRMYDKKLAKEENKIDSLWNFISGIIPYFQEKFSIDGVMIDMGHALPDQLREDIVKSARKKDKEFIFWEENFTLTKKSVDNGYDAVVGYLPFDQHHPEKMKNFIKLLSTKGSPVPYFLTPENHNTPRSADRFNDIKYSKLSWALNCFLPGILFIHGGFETGEKTPVNTGLDFADEQLQLYPPDRLPLFSNVAINWLSHNNIIEFMMNIYNLRNKYLKSILNKYPASIIFVKCSNENIVSFIRKGRKNVLFAGNLNPEKEIYFDLKMPFGKRISNLEEGIQYKVINNSFIYHLQPFGFFIAEVIS